VKILYADKTKVQQCLSKLLILLLALVSFASFSDDELTLPTLDVTNNNEANGDAASQTISQDEIKQQGVLSLSDYFHQNAAVSIKIGTNAATNSLILIDGLPLLSFSHIGPNINSILLENIKQVDVKLGSYGSLYGEQAIGGVVNIVTMVPRKQKKRIAIGAGNFGQAIGELFVSIPTNNLWRYSLSGLAFKTQHIQQKNLQNNYNINLKAIRETENSSATASFYAFDNRTELPPSLIYGFPDSSNNSTEYNFTRIKAQSLVVEQRRYLNNRVTLSTQLLFHCEQNNGIVTTPFNSFQENYVVANNLELFEQTQTGLNLQHQRYQFKNPKLNNHVSANVVNLYGRHTFLITNTINAVIGVRVAKQFMNAKPLNINPVKTTSTALVNEQGLFIKATPTVNIYFRRDGNFRFAKANEKIWVTSNIYNLNDQRGLSYESGIKWTKQNHHGELGVYRLDIHDEIGYDPTPYPDSPFGKMYNLPRTRRLGVSVQENVNVNKFLKLSFQANAVKPYFIEGPFKKKQIPAISPLTTSSGINFWLNKKTLINLSETYNSSAYAAYDLYNQNRPLPPYFLTHFYLKKNWSKYSLSFQLSNVFNKHFPRFASYFPRSNIIRYYPDDGRRVLIKAEASIT
jgi:iron complex outermembrane recepter protein